MKGVGLSTLKQTGETRKCLTGSSSEEEEEEEEDWWIFRSACEVPVLGMFQPQQISCRFVFKIPLKVFLPIQNFGN